MLRDLGKLWHFEADERDLGGLLPVSNDTRSQAVLPVQQRLADSNTLEPDTRQPSFLDLYPVPRSSEGNAHITTVTGEKFNLWKMGWNTFMQIPQYPESTKNVKLLISRNGKKYWGANACAPTYLNEMKILATKWAAGRCRPSLAPSRAKRTSQCPLTVAPTQD